MKQKLLQGKKLEWTVFGLFIILYCIISAFHEPWFDEAQAWQIAKCASLREILFEIPHYEGHPPLWYLILAIPAKLGVPFEPGLKAVGLLFSFASVYIIIFKMPYPRLMRLLLPFTYFVFYQFGIIVRPYVIMMLALLLLACEFPRRFFQTWKYVGLLILLCLTSAYGMVIAGGIAVCMVYELLQEKGWKRFVSGLFTDKRTLALGVLLLSAILIVLEIMPRDDTWVVSADRVNSIGVCLLAAFLTFPGECTLTTSTWFNKDRVLLQNAPIDPVELAVFCVIGIFLWLMIIGAASKKSLKYFLVPYGMMAFFASLVYFSVHHVGVFFLLLLFWIGILFQDEKRFEIGRSLVDKIAKTDRDRMLLKRTAVLVCVVCLMVPMYWCTVSSVNEVKEEFSYGRSGAEFLREYNLTECHILSDWVQSETESYGESIDPYCNTCAVGTPVLLNAYFDHNICMNLNGGRDNEAYMHYRIPSAAEIEETLQEWKAAGIPDVIIGKAEVEQLYGDDITYEDYTLVNVFRIQYIWKNTITGGYTPVYVRTDLLDEHHLEPYENDGMKYFADGITITEEMREQFENGVPVEEILKPYLDAMFGEEK